jgi:hypothetical protein
MWKEDFELRSGKEKECLPIHYLLNEVVNSSDSKTSNGRTISD